MQRDPYKYFRVEARELNDQLSQGALSLDKGAAAAAIVKRLLRVAHTLKGAARVVRQAGIAELAHAIEDGLVPWRESTEPMTSEQVSALLGQIDAIAVQLARLDTPGDVAAGPAAPSESADVRAALPPSPDGAALRSLRADLAEIEALREGLHQSHSQVASLQRDAASATEARELAQRLVERLSRRPSSADRDTGAGGALPLAEQLNGLLRRSARTLQGAAEQLDRGLRQLRDDAEQLRLVPAGGLFAALERCARDTALELGKELRFEAAGGEVRLDADLLAGAQGALVQLVRNAVAHGIEAPARRRAAGKPAAGCVRVSVGRRGRQVLLACHDDGAGIDFDAVRRTAQASRPGAGTGTAEGAWSQPALVELLLRGGLSTAAGLSELAGRGVGLDVVREAAERLGGAVSMHSEPGRGCTVELLLPMSLAALEVLQVECDGRVLQIPLEAVRAARRLAPTDIGRSPQGNSVVHAQSTIPFAGLGALLGLDGGGAPRTAVVVEAEGACAALGVDRLLGTARCVLQPLPAPLPVHALVAGASLDIEGRPLLVLDAAGLVGAARTRAAASPAVARPRRPVLVVDDSLTTRMLEQSILETAGYEVDTAASAEDGLEQARRRPYALFLVDVEMPGMDGFAFIETARADPQLCEVPAMLVTSRASPEDLRRGTEAGARAYVVKSEFAQDRFLHHVRELVGEQ